MRRSLTIRRFCTAGVAAVKDPFTNIREWRSRQIWTHRNTVEGLLTALQNSYAIVEARGSTELWSLLRTLSPPVSQQFTYTSIIYVDMKEHFRQGLHILDFK